MMQRYTMYVKGFEFIEIIINYSNDNTYQRYKKSLRSLKSFNAII